ncbi:24668_t:CDS:2 [Cetraspora pellucida]|uniref:24668_t:CDS:1 n=1 Tax=Cetraspora pellucida TaxID=1433469 RepID=A0A9N9HQR4_9GLOM|nr:24668_t:CDS:2 [Cetraspora pellucida]
MYNVLEVTKKACCEKCKEIIKERENLDKDLKEKKNKKSREEINEAIKNYIKILNCKGYNNIKEFVNNDITQVNGINDELNAEDNTIAENFNII